MSRSTAVIIDGIKFDSKGEGRRWQELCLLERAGEISNLHDHPNFELQPAFVDSEGHKVQPITYTADYGYMENGVQIVEDFKSKASRTQAYMLRVKMLKYHYRDIIFRESY